MLSNVACMVFSGVEFKLNKLNWFEGGIIFWKSVHEPWHWNEQFCVCSELIKK